MTWFEAIVYACVIYLMGIAVGNAFATGQSNVLETAIAAALLLSLVVLHKFASRRPRSQRRAPRRVSLGRA